MSKTPLMNSHRSPVSRPGPRSAFSGYRFPRHCCVGRSQGEVDRSSDAYQISRASSVNASASRAEGGTSVPRS